MLFIENLCPKSEFSFSMKKPDNCLDNQIHVYLNVIRKTHLLEIPMAMLNLAFNSRDMTVCMQSWYRTDLIKHVVCKHFHLNGALYI